MFLTLCLLALWAAAPAADSKRFDALFDEGLQALNREEYGVAVSKLREAVKEAERFPPGDARRLDAAVHLALACGDADDCTSAQWEADLRLARTLSLTVQATDRELERIIKELGDAEYAASNYPQAERTYRRALVLKVKVFGPTHQEVARAHTSLAWVAVQQKDPARARREFEQALGLREKAGAAATAPFAQLVEDYGDLLEELEDLPAADRQYERATAIRSGLWKERDQRFINGLKSIAWTCQSREKLQCAELRYQQVVRIQRDARGEQSPEYLDALHSLAAFYNDKEQWGLAVPISGQCAAVAQGTRRTQTAAACLRFLGDAQAALGQYRLAVEAGEAELAARDALPDQVRSLRNELLARLSSWHLRAGDAATAEKRFEALRSQPDTEALVISAAEQMGDIYHSKANHRAAVAKFELAVATHEAKFASDSQGLILKLNKLADAYDDAGRPNDAQQARTRIIQIGMETAFQGDQAKAAAVGLGILAGFLVIGGGVLALFFWLLSRRVDRQINALFVPPPWWGYATPAAPQAPPDDEPPPLPETAPVVSEEPPPFEDPTDTAPIPERAASEPSPEPALAVAEAAGPELGGVAVAEPPPLPAPQWQPFPLPPSTRLSFHGEGSALFAIRIANLLLGLLTLGVYYFWGKAKIRRYLYDQTEFDGDRFHFHGTGLELLLGWLKGAPVLAFLVLTPYVVPMLWTSRWSLVVAQYVVAAGFWLVWPLARAGAYRYRVNRMSWRGIRFSFRGSTWEFWKLCIKCYGLILVSAGFYYPFYLVRAQAFLTNRTWFGDEPFHYEGEGSDLLPNWAVAGPMFYLTAGLGWAWWNALQQRYHWSRTTFAGARLRCTVRGGRLLWLWAINILVLLFTIGLGTPWVITRTARFWTRNVEIVGWLDLSKVRQDARATSAVGEGFADFLGFDFGF